MNTGRFIALLVVAASLLSACSSVPKTKEYSVLDPLQGRESVYVIPFDATLVPPDFSEPIFNDFVDILNSRRKETKVDVFVILKDELKEVEPSWLIKQVYITGDVWGYVETTGCCSTDMKVKARIHLFESGKNSPTFEIFVPVGHYFEHDRSDIAAEKARLGKKLANDLAEAVIKKLTP